ncbi:hypothetical protein ACJZ2D_015832 [Fusarium nematophilum]
MSADSHPNPPSSAGFINWDERRVAAEKKVGGGSSRVMVKAEHQEGEAPQQVIRMKQPEAPPLGASAGEAPDDGSTARLTGSNDERAGPSFRSSGSDGMAGEPDAVAKGIPVQFPKRKIHRYWQRWVSRIQSRRR